MNIGELKPGQSGVEVEATVTDVGETREFSKFGRVVRVATATIKDDSGEIKLSLWNEDIERVKVGSKIKLSNAFVREFQGEPQLTAGKFGKIEVVGEGEVEAPKEEKIEEEKVEEKKEEKEKKPKKGKK